MSKSWAISDIHGCFYTFRKLVEEKVVLEKSDNLYLLGDFIDRGFYSKELIYYIIELQNSGYQIHNLMGNHEEALIEAYHKEFTLKKKLFRKPVNEAKDAWYSYGGIQTMKSFGIDELNLFPKEIIDYFSNFKKYIELNDYLLVHAGFNFSKENIFEDEKSMLWIRDFDVIPEKIKFKTVVHGHVPVSLEVIDTCIEKTKFHYIPIDNGCYQKDKKGMGALLALNLETRSYVLQKNIEI
jgi:serine/threonine protein phosphatase 1